MAATETSLSAGRVLRSLLLSSEEVAAITGTVYPVTDNEAELPYVLYRRVSVSQKATKSGQFGAEEARYQVVCYSATYAESVELAEAVRAALDFNEVASGALTLRRCVMEDAEEFWDSDAYAQSMTFTMGINYNS